jgi:hypothetical protein
MVHVTDSSTMITRFDALIITVTRADSAGPPAVHVRAFAGRCVYTDYAGSHEGRPREEALAVARSVTAACTDSVPMSRPRPSEPR